jgi:hypothetical protein
MDQFPFQEEKSMNKKLFDLVYALISLVLLLSFGNAVAKAQEGQTQSSPSIFLPIVSNNPRYGHKITGRVVNQQNAPMAGVTIRTDKGHIVTTNSSGEYTLKDLSSDTYRLTPSLGGITFSPASTTVVVPPDVEKLNFTAQVVCSEALVNGSFEDISGWDIPITEYPAGYTLSEAHSGSRSMRTGIVNSADNTYSYSSVRERVTIPAGTTSAYLTFWIKSYTSESGLLSVPEQPIVGQSLDDIQLSGDVQYVLVLDSNFNIINTLIWQRSNNHTWTSYQFNLAGYAGRTIWLHFGTYNDGVNGITSMFVDDVSLVICPSGSPTPTPTTGPCGNLLQNSGFESSSAWEIPITAYPAGYSTAQAHTGSRSMRTGILKSTDNIFSYSDFRQRVSIPAGTSAAAARFWLYTLSGENQSISTQDSITPTGKPFDQTMLSGDLQYVLILDQYQNWIDTLVWQRSDEGHWHYYEFDLRRYAGSIIYLQFGTYNDGLNGITGMFVDDASLDNCTTTPTPGPSPTPTRTPSSTPTPTITPTTGPCQQLIVNSNFDGSNGWIILDTAYPASYSYAQYHSAFRSMRTGIVNPSDNIYSYSDFRQVVTLPSNMKHVTLNMWVYFSSSGVTGLSKPESIVPTGKPFDQTVLSDDLQYLLILDQNQNWIGTMIWQRSNSQVWTSMSFDLSGYTGTTIMLQWGTFNNGTGGITSMYVDDVTLQVCP